MSDSEIQEKGDPRSGDATPAASDCSSETALDDWFRRFDPGLTAEDSADEQQDNDQRLDSESALLVELRTTWSSAAGQKRRRRRMAIVAVAATVSLLCGGTAWWGQIGRAHV